MLARSFRLIEQRRIRSLLSLLLLSASVAGCQVLRTETEARQPAGLMATTQAPYPATPTPPGTGEPVVDRARNLEWATALIVGAGQTDTIKVTDAATIRALAQMAASAPVTAEPQRENVSLYFVSFQAEGQQLAQLWVLRTYDGTAVPGIRFDDESNWRAVSSGLNAALLPLLRQVPGMWMP